MTNLRLDIKMKTTQESIFSSIQSFSDRLFYILVVLILALAANRVVQHLINRLGKVVEVVGQEALMAQKVRLKTIRGVMRNITSLSIWAVSVLIVLSEFGIDIGPLIAGAGVIGFAIGFGSQQLVRDFLGGFFVLLENQYNRGDKVEIAGKSGVVKQINLRTTILEGENNTVYIVPNSQIGIVTRIFSSHDKS